MFHLRWGYSVKSAEYESSWKSPRRNCFPFVKKDEGNRQKNVGERHPREFEIGREELPFNTLQAALDSVLKNEAEREIMCCALRSILLSWFWPDFVKAFFE